MKIMTVNLNLSNAKNGTFEDATGVLTINDNDDAPSISINDGTTNVEGGRDINGNFIFCIGKTVTVHYKLPMKLYRSRKQLKFLLNMPTELKI